MRMMVTQINRYENPSVLTGMQYSKKECRTKDEEDKGGKLGDDFHQLHLGTRGHRCGCSLPGLTRFTVYRCVGTSESHHN